MHRQIGLSFLEWYCDFGLLFANILSQIFIAGIFWGEYHLKVVTISSLFRTISTNK